MPKRNTADAQAIAAGFLDRYLEDQAAGRTRTLDDYLALYPGNEDVVAREFAALEGDGSYAATSVVADDIAARLDQDRANGIEPTLADYLVHFPGRELEVADALAARRDEGEGDGAMPDRMGSYEIVRELGRGGQATVYLARDGKLDREVALKVVVTSSALPTSSVRQRFEREALTAARLDHPNLCAVYEVGEQGMLAYIAMRYVRGETLAARIAKARGQRRDGDSSVLEIAPARTDASDSSATHRTKLAATLQALEELARAVHVAHEAGVLHRDIKPGNVMLTPEGKPVLLDFGLAQNREGSDMPSLTRTGDVLGTPRYMAPEQVRGETTIDRRADVYALAATLYEALTGRAPFEAPDVQNLYQLILTKDPVRADRVGAGIPADLGIVLAMALEKEPARRYATALDFAEDLRRVRVHEPILATPASAMSQVQKFVKRHRGLSAGLALAGLSLVVAAVAVYHALQPVEAPAPVTLSEGAAEWVVYRNDFAACLAALEVGDRVEARRIHAGMSPEKRGWEWDFLGAHLDQTLARRESGFYAAPLAFDDDGRALSVRAAGDRAELFDVETGESLGDLGPAGATTIFRFDGDVTRLAKHQGFEVTVYDLETLAAVFSAPTALDERITLDLDGDTLAVSTPDGRVEVWSVAGGERRFTFEPTAPTTNAPLVELDGTGGLLACVERPKPGAPTLVLLDAVTGERLRERRFPSPAFNAAAMSQDGTLLAVTQPTGLHVLELPTLETRFEVLSDDFDTRHSVTRSSLGCLSFTPDGVTLLHAPATGTITAYDVAAGEPRFQVVVPFGVQRTLVDEGGTRVLTSGHVVQEVHLQQLGRPAGGVHVGADAEEWFATVTTREEVPSPLGRGGDASVTTASVDGRWIATGGRRSGTIELWDRASGEPVVTITAGAGDVLDLDFHRAGKRLASVGSDGAVRLWDLASFQLAAVLEGDARTARFSPDGSRLVAMLGDGAIQVWDTVPPHERE